MEARVSVAMVSDDRVFAEAVAASLALQDGFEVLPLDGDGAAAAPPPADVVLVDSAAGHEAALERLHRLQDASTGAKLIVLGVERDGDQVVEIIEAGANGYLSKQTSPEELAQAIRTVVRGGAHCSPRVAASVVARIADLTREPPAPAPRLSEPLTMREREVLIQIARGLRNKEIGRDLGITVQTVKNHVHSVLAKLGVHRRRQAVLLGFRLGILDEEECDPGEPG